MASFVTVSVGPAVRAFTVGAMPEAVLRMVPAGDPTQPPALPPSERSRPTAMTDKPGTPAVRTMRASALRGHAAAHRVAGRAEPTKKLSPSVLICNWLGDIAKRIAASAAISINIVKGYAPAFESAGSDELISSAPRPRRTSSSCSPARCRSTPGLARAHGLVNGLG